MRLSNGQHFVVVGAVNSSSLSLKAFGAVTLNMSTFNYLAVTAVTACFI